jgi:hypothetical protein
MDGHPAPVDRTLAQGTPWRLAEHLEGREPWLPELDRWLHAHYPHGKFRGPIFTSETAGDYLVWSLPEEMPVFAYAHVHLLTWEHWQQVAAVRNGTVHWRTVLDHHRINLLVVEAELNKRLRGLLYQDKEWQVIYDEYEDPQVYDFRCRLLVAVRKTPLR